MEEMQTPFIISSENIKKGYNFTKSMMKFDVASTIAYIFNSGIDRTANETGI